jgi:hypothetical protein
MNEEALRRALTELIACKDLKERVYRLAGMPAENGGSEAYTAALDEYQRRKPLAWDAARAALSEGQAPEPEDAEKKRGDRLWQENENLRLQLAEACAGVAGSVASDCANLIRSLVHPKPEGQAPEPDEPIVIGPMNAPLPDEEECLDAVCLLLDADDETRSAAAWVRMIYARATQQAPEPVAQGPAEWALCPICQYKAIVGDGCSRSTCPMAVAGRDTARAKAIEEAETWKARAMFLLGHSDNGMSNCYSLNEVDAAIRALATKGAGS